MKSITFHLIGLAIAVTVCGCSHRITSPDGKYAAYYKSGSLVIADADSDKVLNTFADLETPFCWINDSSGLLTGVYHEGIYLLPIKGESKLLIETSGGNYDHDPAQSADGRYTYFLHHEWAFQVTVCRIDSDTLFRSEDAWYPLTYELCDVIGHFRTKAGDEHVVITPRKDGRVKVGKYGVFGAKNE